MKDVNSTVNQSEVEANTWNGAERQARENALKFRGLGIALTTSWSCFMEDQCLTSLTHVNSQLIRFLFVVDIVGSPVYIFEKFTQSTMTDYS